MHIVKEIILLIHPISKQRQGIYQHNIPTTSLLINVEAKMEIKRRAMTQSLKTRTVTRVELLVHMPRIL